MTQKLRVALVAFVLGILGVLGLSSPADAADACIINVVGVKVCGELLEPLPTITVKPDPIVIPGPTETATVRPPAVTVRPPAATVTEPAPPAETVTRQPGPVGPSELPDTEPQPTETVTETTTVSPSETRQTTDNDGTIVPDEKEEGLDFSLDFGDGAVSTGEAVIGTLTLLALAGLLLFTLYLGYILGWKDKENQETNFMRALLDVAKSR